MISRPTTSTVRWTVCALILFATTVNYLDRFLFSLLVPFFEDDLRLGPNDLALINVSFIVPYGLSMIFVGRYVDRVGIKKGLSTSFLLWNAASLAHAFVNSLGGFIGIRFLLGIGESGMFPAAIKTMTDWFPIKERSLATGIFNAGSNMGAMLAPLVGVAIAVRFGWRACFMLTGGIGMVWILFWWSLYRPPQENLKVSEAELALIHSDPVDETSTISYRQLFGIAPLYGLAIAKALSDAPWWLYLTWVPKFLIDQFHVTATFMAFAVPIVYVVADVGSVAGGWLSSTLIKCGKSIGFARKTTMLMCAILVTPVMAVGFLVDRPTVFDIPSVYWAIGIIALAAGAHQGWSCNLFTLVSDTVPKSAVAMAVGAINGFAMVGVSAMQFFVGRSVQLTSSYTLPFIVAGSLYLVALVVIQLFMPTVQPSETKRLARIPIVIAGTAVVLLGLATLQYALNRPPYLSESDYLAVRRIELKVASSPVVGPVAKVGWMSAKWFGWRLPNGKSKFELVKFDTHRQPIVEAKGEKAAKYVGPSISEVTSTITRLSTP